MKQLVNLDLNKNELQNAVMHPLATAPASPKLGQVYYNSTDNLLYVYNGGTIGWEAVGAPYDDTDIKQRLTAIEGKEAGWNAKYDKPTTGIPKTDLASAVQTSLGLADSALQEVPNTYRTAAAQDVIDNGKVDKETGKGLSTNDYDNTEKGKVANAVQKDGSVAMTGNLNMNSHKITGVTAGTADTDAVNKKQMDDAIDALPEPMIFKGSVGTGGTVIWENLPAASASEGFTYKVIEAHATAPAAKVGDTIISNGTEWVVIPSGDEPSGTVTSVGVTGDDYIGVSGSPVTSDGTIALTSKIKAATGTIAVGQTSVTVSGTTSNVIAVSIFDASGNEVVADVAKAASSVTVTIAQSYASALTVKVLYLAS